MTTASGRAVEFAEISAGLVPSAEDCRPFYFKDLPELIARRTATGDENSTDSEAKTKIEYSDGSEPRRTLYKPSTEILLTKVNQNFIKSSHAFSARVDELGKRELFRSAVDPSRTEPLEPETLPPAGPAVNSDATIENQPDPVAEASGSVTFSLRSEVLVGEAAKKGGTSGGGSILLGVGPKGTSLESPLSWEEPDAYFIECSTKGAFFWSDAAMKFGSKVSDTCLMPLQEQQIPLNQINSADSGDGKKKSDDSVPESEKSSETWGAVVNVSWDRNRVSFTQFPHPQAKVIPSEEENGSVVENKSIWSLPFVATESCEDPSLQKRYAIVTLLGIGDYVEILSSQ